MPQALIGAGSNLGDRLATLRAAWARLRAADGIGHLETSDVYETAPVGLTEQPKFLNVVFGGETQLDPEALLRVLQQIETEFGRERAERWGPRTLDLDLLVYEEETRATPTLILPHPRMFERAFVLVPLAELLSRAKFANSAWSDLRNRVARANVDATGVARFGSSL